jgi:hypothetical protein
MFNIKTLLVLGAGASVPYGYKTSNGLVGSISTEKRGLYNQEEKDFISLFEKSPSRTIDEFVFQNPSKKELAQKIIAKAICEYEAQYATQPWIDKGKKTHQDNDWYKIFVATLLSGVQKPEDILKNNISVITFNYDVSFERYTTEALQNVEILKQGTKDYGKEFCEKFFNENVLHVYGKIGDVKSYGKRNLEDCYKNIKFIDDKDNNPQEVGALIEDVERVFIFGFGFHDINIKNAGLYDLKQTDTLRISYTNYEGSAEIDRKVKQIARQGHVVKGSKTTEGIKSAIEKSFIFGE